jgi:hypothetical protein
VVGLTLIGHKGMGAMGEIVKELGRDLPYRGGVEFNCLVRHLLIGKGDPFSALASAEAEAATPRRCIEVLKAAVTGGSLADPAWAGAIGSPARPIIAAYVESLASASFFDRALADNSFVKVPPRTPIVIVTQSAVGSTVAELAPTPISSMTLSAPSVALRKSIAEVVLSVELAREPASTGLIGRELQRAAVKAVDTTAIGVIIASGTSAATAGPTLAHLVTDVQTMFNAIEKGEQSRLYFVLNYALAAALAARAAGTAGWALRPTGGELAGVPVVVSSGAPAGNLTLVDASRFAAYSDVITLATSQEGMVQMNTAPDSPPTGSTSFVSLYQQNLVALRATRYWGLQALTTTAAATTTGMS